MRIAVIGTGYVGLVSGACFAEMGHDVIGVDCDLAKVDALRQGGMPIYEPGLLGLVQRNRDAGRLSFTSDIREAVAEAKVVLLAVGTPARQSDGRADLSFVYAASRQVGAVIGEYTAVVIKSTVPVGTADTIRGILGGLVPATRFSVVSNPEFLREGTAIGDFMKPDRVVIGFDSPRARRIMADLYLPLREQNVPILLTDNRTAELIKYTANAYLAMKITFINEIANLCEAVDANVRDVASGVGLDGRIGTKFLQPGPGYGGSCFPKDTIALLRTAQEHGVALRLVEDTIMVNESRRRAMAQKVRNALGGSVEGAKIAVLGLTFKPDTDDMREAPSLSLIDALQRGGARIHAHDPVGTAPARCHLDEVIFFDDPYECVAQTDAVVIMTEWASLCTLDLGELRRLMVGTAFVDLRNAYPEGLVTESGFAYTGIGRASKCPPVAHATRERPRAA